MSSTPQPLSRTSLARNKIRIVLLEGIHEQAVQAFERAGYTNVERHAKSLPPGKLEEALADAHVVGVRSRTQLTPEVLAAAPKLFAVGCFCIGTNQVALDAAQERGIPVFNAPFSNTRSVAELVLAEIVMLLRGIPAKNSGAHRGEWAKTAVGSHEARGHRLGIVGYGHIGTQVGLLAEAFGMEVVFHDVVPKLALGNARAAADLDEVLRTCDVVTLHVPQTESTQGMIGPVELGKMKAGSHLINASRGTVVDIPALAEAVRSGHLAGAAVDVFPVEPKSNQEEFVSELRGLDNVLLTPHIGGSTEEAQQNIGAEVAGKLLLYSDNGSTIGAVNFPEVALPTHEGRQRLLNIHQNAPGAMARVNEVIYRRGLNVAAQYLETTASIGYVVMDVGTDADVRGIRRELDALDGTIRSRVLF